MINQINELNEHNKQLKHNKSILFNTVKLQNELIEILKEEQESRESIKLKEYIINLQDALFAILGVINDQNNFIQTDAYAHMFIIINTVIANSLTNNSIKSYFEKEIIKGQKIASDSFGLHIK